MPNTAAARGGKRQPAPRVEQLLPNDRHVKLGFVAATATLGRSFGDQAQKETAGRDERGRLFGGRIFFIAGVIVIRRRDFVVCA